MKNDCNVDTKKVYSKVEDFLKDDDFIKYVLDDAPEMAFHWDKLLKEHAERKHSASCVFLSKL